MQDFINYFTRVENIVSLTQFLFFGIITLLLFKRTGNVKVLEKFFKSDIFNNFLGGADMTANKTSEAQGVCVGKGQTFNKFQKVYRLNKATNVLEDTGELVDMQEVINSGLSQCLTEVLSKFFPDNVPKNDDIVQLDNLTDDIDSLNEAFMVADSYKATLGLADDTPMGQVFEAMHKKAIELREAFDKVKKLEEEEISNEKKIVEESK